MIINHNKSRCKIIAEAEEVNDLLFDSDIAKRARSGDILLHIQ
jgi:hypothetical protein